MNRPPPAPRDHGQHEGRHEGQREALPDAGHALAEVVRRLLGAATTLAPLRSRADVADATILLLATDGAMRHVVHLAPAGFPDAVAQACVRARAFAAGIGPALGAAILLPLAEDRVDGRSLAIFPHRRPYAVNGLRFRIERPLLAPAILRWLRDVARLSTTYAGDAARIADYRANLDALARLPGIDADLARAARSAADRVAAGQLAPIATPMHGDLWLGNILRATPAGGARFALIDWGGARLDGYPIFDLVRVAMSLRLSPRRLAVELAAHADALGCPPSDTEPHLLAALGHFARDRGEMPVAALAAMARDCVGTYRRGVA